MNITPSRFYIQSGALPRNAPSYVHRQADVDLYQGLLNGDFCYVLSSRQMGKSSLMIRTAVRLREAGCSVAIVDPTLMGNNLTVEQWYDGLLGQIGRRLGLTEELDRFWQNRKGFSPLQRCMGALEEVILPNCPRPVVIFIDEIDSIRSLPFSVEELFAAIRSCYNLRAEDTEFKRATFCLLGVASPSDLIQDPRITPFNVGLRIELTDFTPEEAQILAEGLTSHANARRLLARILYWTGGHPCLTQRLCHAVAETPNVTQTDGVDRICQQRFLSKGAERREDNLVFVNDRLLKSKDDLSELLTLYRRVWSGKPIPEEETSLSQMALKLSGIIKTNEGVLQVRNRIYRHVFDADWIMDNMPDAEKRRQRAAYRQGVVRTSLIFALLFTAFGSLIFIAASQYRRAEQNYLLVEQANRFAYSADMNLVQQDYNNGDYGQAEQLLEVHLPKPSDTEDLRGFEWRYYWRLMHSDLHTFHHPGKNVVFSVAISPEGKTLAAANGSGMISLWDTATQREITTFQSKEGVVWSLAFCPTQGNMLAAGSGNRVRLWQMDSRSSVILGSHKDQVLCIAFSREGQWLASGSNDGEVRLWNPHSQRELRAQWRRGDDSPCVRSIVFSKDDQWLAAGLDDGTIQLLEIPSLRPVFTLMEYKEESYIDSLALSPDGKILAAGRQNGPIEIWDVRSRRLLQHLTGHKDAVNGMDFSPKGRYLATGSWDNTIGLWDVTTWKMVKRIIGHTNRVTSVVFSPNGEFLASGGSHEIKVWNPIKWEENPRQAIKFRAGLFSLIVSHFLSAAIYWTMWLIETQRSWSCGIAKHIRTNRLAPSQI